MKKSLLMAMVFLLMVTSVTFSYTTTYGDFIGGTPTRVDFLGVQEESSTDPTPLYGTPRRVGNRLIFTPSHYIATASGCDELGVGRSDTTTGILKMDIKAPAGDYDIQSITITESGGFQLTGVGANTNAQVSGLLNGKQTGSETWYTDHLTAPPNSKLQFSLPDDSEGSWSGSAYLDFTGMGFRQVTLFFQNTLVANSESGTSAQISKLSVGDSAVIEVFLPEPATLLILAVGGWLFGIPRKTRK